MYGTSPTLTQQPLLGLCVLAGGQIDLKTHEIISLQRLTSYGSRRLLKHQYSDLTLAHSEVSNTINTLLLSSYGARMGGY